MPELKQPSGQRNLFLGIEKFDLPQYVARVAICNLSTAPGGLLLFKQILAHVELDSANN